MDGGKRKSSDREDGGDDHTEKWLLKRAKFDEKDDGTEDILERQHKLMTFQRTAERTARMRKLCDRGPGDNRGGDGRAMRLVDLNPSLCTVGANLKRPDPTSPVHIFDHFYNGKIGPIIQVEGRLIETPVVNDFDRVDFAIEIEDIREEHILRRWSTQFDHQFRTTAVAKQWATSTIVSTVGRSVLFRTFAEAVRPTDIENRIRYADPSYFPEDGNNPRTGQPIECDPMRFKAVLWFNKNKLQTVSTDENDIQLNPFDFQRGNKIRMAVQMSYGYYKKMTNYAPGEFGLTRRILLLKRLDTVNPEKPPRTRWADETNDTTSPPQLPAPSPPQLPAPSPPQLPAPSPPQLPAPSPPQLPAPSPPPSSPISSVPQPGDGRGWLIELVQQGSRRLQQGSRRLQQGSRRLQQGSRRLQQGLGKRREDMNDGVMIVMLQQLTHEIFFIFGVVDLIIAYARGFPIFACLEVWRGSRIGLEMSCFNPSEPSRRVTAIVAVDSKIPATETEDWVGLIVPTNLVPGFGGADRTVFAPGGQHMRHSLSRAPPSAQPPNGMYVVHYVNLAAGPQYYIDRSRRPGGLLGHLWTRGYIELQDRNYIVSAPAYRPEMMCESSAKDADRVFKLPAEIPNHEMDLVLQNHLSANRQH